MNWFALAILCYFIFGIVFSRYVVRDLDKHGDLDEAVNNHGPIPVLLATLVIVFIWPFVVVKGIIATRNKTRERS